MLIAVELELKTADFLNAVPDELVELTAADGVHLAGIVYEHDDVDNRWVIVVHGYRDTNQSGYVLDMAQHYYDAGFNVLTPDLRAFGTCSRPSCPGASACRSSRCSIPRRPCPTRWRATASRRPLRLRR